MKYLYDIGLSKIAKSLAKSFWLLYPQDERLFSLNCFRRLDGELAKKNLKDKW